MLIDEGIIRAIQREFRLFGGEFFRGGRRLRGMWDRNVEVRDKILYTSSKVNAIRRVTQSFIS
jgi:hypothetical protein